MRSPWTWIDHPTPRRRPDGSPGAGRLGCGGGIDPPGRAGWRVLAGLWLLCGGLLLSGGAVARDDPPHRAAPAIVAERFEIATPAGPAQIPVSVSQDWSRPLARVMRAVIMVHGVTRDAELYARHVEQARAASGTLALTSLLIAPQFLTATDIDAHALPTEALRWSYRGWSAGEAALAPAPLSSFDVLDALLVRLSDRSAFPLLTHIVVAGHSAGAQLVQRHAVVGRGDAAARERGIAVRYVIANPSSWLWFGEDRPYPAEPGACPDFDLWRYGLRGAPPYVGDTAALEGRYLARDVVYLAGEADRDPGHGTLDRSCAAMTQGESRFARAMHFMLGLELRRPNQVYHRLLIIRDVGHQAGRMFVAPCGLAALFDRPGCIGMM
jgi:hypothetical protein